MFKVPHPRNHHRQLVLHAIIDRVLVPDGSTRLDKRGDPGGMCYLHTVVKGEESIAGEHGALQVEIKLTGLGYRLAKGIDTARLAAALADKLAVFHQGDGI